MMDSMSDLDVGRLRGLFRTYIARGDASVPLPILVKTVRTDLRKGHYSQGDVRAALEDGRTTGVDGFKQWKSYSDRERRFQALREAASGILDGPSA